jgi:hypothetical protein
MAERYRVLTGMNYGDHERRLEPGDLTPVDFPAASVGWLLAHGHLEPVDAAAPPPVEPEVVDEAPVELAPGESDPAVGDQE